MSDDGDDYDVGYKKPPKEQQFQKGQTGNRKGRPKGTRNFRTDVEEILSSKVSVTDGGGQKKVSSQLASLMRLKEKALKGDPRALDRFVSMAAEHSAEKEALSAERKLSSNEQDILEKFREDIIRSAAPISGDGKDDEGHNVG